MFVCRCVSGLCLHVAKTKCGVWYMYVYASNDFLSTSCIAVERIARLILTFHNFNVRVLSCAQLIHVACLSCDF
jgi:hypothetical protein